MTRRLADGLSTSIYVDGVVVEACSVKDTLYTTTANGIFQFRKVTVKGGFHFEHRIQFENGHSDGLSRKVTVDISKKIMLSDRNVTTCIAV